MNRELNKCRTNLQFLQISRQGYFQAKTTVDGWLREYSASLYAYALRVWREEVDAGAESAPFRCINSFGVLGLDWSPSVVMDLRENLAEKGKERKVLERYQKASQRLQDEVEVRITLLDWMGSPVAVGKPLENQWAIWAGINNAS